MNDNACIVLYNALICSKFYKASSVYAYVTRSVYPYHSDFGVNKSYDEKGVTYTYLKYTNIKIVVCGIISDNVLTTIISAFNVEVFPSFQDIPELLFSIKSLVITLLEQTVSNIKDKAIQT